MDTEAKSVQTGRLGKRWKVLVHPGRHYAVCHISRPSEPHKTVWITDGEYVGIDGELLRFRVLNGSERKVHIDRIIEIQRLTQVNRPTADVKAEVLGRFNEWRQNHEC